MTQTLDEAISVSLDGLLHALELEPVGGDRFRVPAEPARFDRIFGGQAIAQALVAATATVAGKLPNSLHAYFVEAGTAGEPLEIGVDRVRDGRSIATRRVTVSQGDRTLLTLIASFHDGPANPEFADPAPEAPAPLDLPLLQDWFRDLPPALAPHGRMWVDQPPPLDMRIGEAPNFAGGPTLQGPRSHWMRLPREVGDDAGLHSALLAYASDYLLLDMMLRSHPERSELTSFSGFSLDHAVWFHRPVRFDRWHLHTQQTQAIAGHRGLVRGLIHDEDGQLVASCMQEVLIRPRRPSGSR